MLRQVSDGNNNDGNTHDVTLDGTEHRGQIVKKLLFEVYPASGCCQGHEGTKLLKSHALSLLSGFVPGSGSNRLLQLGGKIFLLYRCHDNVVRIDHLGQPDAGYLRKQFVGVHL
jgi:hypothetical protein